MAVQTQSKGIYWYLVLLFLLLSVAIGTAGYSFYQNQKGSLRQKEWDQLSAIADSKVKEIVNWRKERVADAAAIFNNPLISVHFEKFLNDPAFPSRQEISNWLSSLREYLQYESILLLDGKGTVRLSFPQEPGTIGPTATSLALESMQKREVIFSDLYRDEMTHAICLDLFVPVLAPKAKDRIPVGVLILRIDPLQYLFPLIQSWPTPSQTSEALLVRREGEEGVYLNELRHQKDTALTLRFRLREAQLPAAMALRGQEGIVEGIDYRGIPVLAVVRWVPGSPWFLVSKVDQEEIYAPVRQRAWFTAMLVSLLIVGTGLGVGLLWRGQVLRERMQFEEGLKKANVELEKRVEERTVELHAINDSLTRENLERRQAEETVKESEKQLRYLSSQLMLAQENERKRIARELHDGLGQSLSAIKFSVENFLRQAGQGGIRQEARSLETIIPMIQESVREIHRIQTNLRPSILDDLGILAAISSLCREFQSTYPAIEIEKQVAIEEREVPDSLKVTIYRILQEALNNVVKHSCADHVYLSLRKTDCQIELSIRDNGCGFLLEETLSLKKARQGLGLVSMKERTETSGGLFDVDSDKGKGTVISARWPVENTSFQVR